MITTADWNANARGAALAVRPHHRHHRAAVRAAAISRATATATAAEAVCTRPAWRQGAGQVLGVRVAGLSE